MCAPSVDIDMTSATAFTQRLSIYVKGDLTLSTWQDNPAYRAVMLNSALPRVSAGLMQSDTGRLRHTLIAPGVTKVAGKIGATP